MLYANDYTDYYGITFEYNEVSTFYLLLLCTLYIAEDLSMIQRLKQN